MSGQTIASSIVLPLGQSDESLIERLWESTRGSERLFAPRAVVEPVLSSQQRQLILHRLHQLPSGGVNLQLVKSRTHHSTTTTCEARQGSPTPLKTPGAPTVQGLNATGSPKKPAFHEASPSPQRQQQLMEKNEQPAAMNNSAETNYHRGESSCQGGSGGIPRGHNINHHPHHPPPTDFDTASKGVTDFRDLIAATIGLTLTMSDGEVTELLAEHVRPNGNVPEESILELASALRKRSIMFEGDTVEVPESLLQSAAAFTNAGPNNLSFSGLEPTPPLGRSRSPRRRNNRGRNVSLILTPENSVPLSKRAELTSTPEQFESASCNNNFQRTNPSYLTDMEMARLRLSQKVFAELGGDFADPTSMIPVHRAHRFITTMLNNCGESEVSIEHYVAQFERVYDRLSFADFDREVVEPIFFLLPKRFREGLRRAPNIATIPTAEESSMMLLNNHEREELIMSSAGGGVGGATGKLSKENRHGEGVSGIGGSIGGGGAAAAGDMDVSCSPHYATAKTDCHHHKGSKSRSVRRKNVGAAALGDRSSPAGRSDAYFYSHHRSGSSAIAALMQDTTFITERSLFKSVQKLLQKDTSTKDLRRQLDHVTQVCAARNKVHRHIMSNADKIFASRCTLEGTGLIHLATLKPVLISRFTAHLSNRRRLTVGRMNVVMGRIGRTMSAALSLIYDHNAKCTYCKETKLVASGAKKEAKSEQSELKAAQRRQRQLQNSTLMMSGSHSGDMLLNASSRSSPVRSRKERNRLQAEQAAAAQSEEDSRLIAALAKCKTISDKVNLVFQRATQREHSFSSSPPSSPRGINSKKEINNEKSFAGVDGGCNKKMVAAPSPASCRRPRPPSAASWEKKQTHHHEDQRHLSRHSLNGWVRSLKARKQQQEEDHQRAQYPDFQH